jgi:hypothetical protein
MSDKDYGPGGGVGLAVDAFAPTESRQDWTAFKE